MTRLGLLREQLLAIQQGSVQWVRQDGIAKEPAADELPAQSGNGAFLASDNVQAQYLIDRGINCTSAGHN